MLLFLCKALLYTDPGLLGAKAGFTAPTNAAEREGTNLKGVKDIYPKNGSGPGQNVAMTVLFAADFARQRCSSTGAPR